MRTEIIQGEETPKQEIDWNVIQLVKSKHDTIVLTTGEHGISFFSGIQITTNLDEDGGHYTTCWDKKEYEAVTEPITIKFIQ